MSSRPVLLVFLGALGIAIAPVPVGAHAGTADGTRPMVTSVDPALPGLAATASFAGDWQISVNVVGDQPVSVLDSDGRAFLRIGPQGVEGDYGAPAWFASAAIEQVPGRLPAGVTPDSPPDWRPVARSRSWAWFDPRTRSEPGLVTPEMIRAGVPVRLRDFSIPLQVGDRTAAIRGYLEFEPPRGVYRHRLLSPAEPAPGVEVRLLEGQAVPTITLRNDSAQEVTVLGADGEPFLRTHTIAEANSVSPTWVQVARGLGRTPKGVADPAAEPRWELISEGRLLSWTDFRSKPPDSEPQIAGATGRSVEVRRWTIPLRIGEQAGAIEGVTDFEPFRPPGQEPSRSGFVVAAAGTAVVALVISALLVRRRGSRSLP
jgi:hypothetical protein